MRIAQMQTLLIAVQPILLLHMRDINNVLFNVAELVTTNI